MEETWNARVLVVDASVHGQHIQLAVGVCCRTVPLATACRTSSMPVGGSHPRRMQPVEVARSHASCPLTWAHLDFRKWEKKGKVERDALRRKRRGT